MWRLSCSRACDPFGVALKPLPLRSLCTPECRQAPTDKPKNTSECAHERAVSCADVAHA